MVVPADLLSHHIEKLKKVYYTDCDVFLSVNWVVHKTSIDVWIGSHLVLDSRTDLNATLYHFSYKLYIIKITHFLFVDARKLAHKKFKGQMSPIVSNIGELEFFVFACNMHIKSAVGQDHLPCAWLLYHLVP